MPSSQADKMFREIGKRIAKNRKRLGISQDRLALDSGLDRSHVGFIEQGRRRPTLTTLHRIAKVLRIKLEDLVRGL